MNRTMMSPASARRLVAPLSILMLLLSACATEAPPIEEAAEGGGSERAASGEATTGGTTSGEATSGEATSEDGDADVGALDDVSIRVPFGPSGGLMAPYLYGAAEGIYEEQGISLTVDDGAGSLVTAQDVAAGNSDVTFIGGSALAQGIAGGMPLISVGGVWVRPQFGVLVPEDSDITDLTQLEGKSVITSPGSPETVLMPAAFEAVGVDASTVEVISVDAPAKASSYVQGLGDTVGTSWPYFAAIFESQGRKSRPLLFEDAGVGFPEFHVVVHKQMLEDEPELVERFLRATYESFDAALDEPDGAIAALMEARPAVTDPAPHKQSLLDHAEFACTESMAGQPVGYHVAEDWEAGLEILQQYGGLEGAIEDLDQFFTNQFFEGDNPVSSNTCPWP